jgi:hypothetical protein
MAVPPPPPPRPALPKQVNQVINAANQALTTPFAIATQPKRLTTSYSRKRAKRSADYKRGYGAGYYAGRKRCKK